MNIFNNYNLKTYNTFNLDIKSDFFSEAFNIDEIITLYEFGQSKKINYLVLGGGSNILFTNDFSGLVLRYVKDEINIIDEDKTNTIVEVGAGTKWDKFVEFCVNNNLYGAENLSLIPGNVGASPIQNIGAYGVELKDIFQKLEFFNFENGKIENYNSQVCNFGYRTSIFKHELKNKGIITKVNFRLSKIEKYNINYKALNDFLANEKEINLFNVRNAVINIRESKIPDYNVFGNAGSFFKNPEINKSLFNDLYEKYPYISYFKVDENKYKLAAGWLIENCGFKGFRKGDVGCFDKQALIIVNYGNAKGSDIVAFSDEIKKEVLKKFNIELETEVNII